LKENCILRFSTVGIANTIIDIAVFTAIVNLTSWPAYAAQCAGYAAGMINSFAMNKVWTFKRFDTGSSMVGEALRFFAVNAFSMVVSSSTMWMLTDIFGFSALISKSVILLLILVINYSGYRFWVFTK